MRVASGHMSGLSAPLLGLPGVGPKTAEKLAAAGLRTRADALLFVPRRWDDLRAVTPIGRLEAGRPQTTRGEVLSSRVVFAGRRFFEVVFTDEEGSKLRALWFRFRGSLKERFTPGARFVVSGTPRPYKERLQMAHPETTPLDDESGDAGAGVRARYPEIEGVGDRAVARLCHAAALAHASEIVDGLPEALRRARGLPSLGEALAVLHLAGEEVPPDEIAALAAGTHPAQRRLAFDELFFLQLGILRRRAALLADEAPACAVDRHALDRFLGALGFAPTAAQRRAVDEIAAEMARPRPMHRLLQGDVGAGKTVVMYAAAEVAMAAGRQVAVMAPTELLAEQHARTLGPWAAHGGRRLALLTASTARAGREQILAGLASGTIDLVVGTHALVSDPVRFARLGLVVIDEQHRFGVAQRAALREKGEAGRPHLLVMTATPIPRTLALTVHGDLDITTLDEMPPGRVAPKTRLCAGKRGRADAWALLPDALAAGRQAFVVCPRVDADGDGDGDGDPGAEAASAERTFARLAGELPDVAIELVHGRLPPAARERAMERFRSGAARLLVATTVIEVGVDVPGAEVMLIEGADRFGLAQLHQLRGRIGRGSGGARALCLLVTDAPSASEAASRLKVLVASSDGFAIAEEDLRLRGPGEVYGTRQAGAARLRFADLTRDLDLLREARAAAQALLARDPDLALPEHAATRATLDERVRSGRLFATEAG